MAERETSTVAPREAFPLRSRTGRGARVLLLADDLPAGWSFGGRARVEDAREGEAPRSHALRVASIVGEGEEAAGRPGGPLGLAPDAELVHASHAGMTVEGIGERIRALGETHGRAHVLGLAWSGPEDHHLAHVGRALVTQWADAAPHAVATLAAAGHDGPGRLRFPASCEAVLAVGVCDEAGRPVSWCGADAAPRKPELFVAERRWAARMPGGGLGALDGTSGAVAVATGLAARVCQALLEAGLEPTPALVRAALLAQARPLDGVAGRELVDGPLRPFAGSEARPALGETRRFALHARDRRVTVVACVRRHGRALGWVDAGPEVALRVRDGDGRLRAEGAARGWEALDVEAEPGETLLVELTLGGSARSVALVASGAELAHASDSPGAPESSRASAPAQPSAASRASASPRSRDRRRPLRVLGLAASHDGSACLLRDGRPEVAIPLERLTRVKHDGEGALGAEEAARYCLDSAGLRPEDVDAFAFNSQPLLPGWVGLSQPLATAGFALFDPLGPRSFFVSHHLAHAWAAFAASPFDAALVVVADGSGGSTVGADDLVLRGPALRDYLAAVPPRRPALHVLSAYAFRRGEPPRLLSRETADSFNVRCGSSSLGETYAAVSAYVFGSWHASGKLMGLAPHGDAERYGPSLLEEGPDGLLRFTTAWKLREARRDPPADPMAHRDLAARVQADFERALLQRVERARRATDLEAIVFTGGLALNSCFNQRLVEARGAERCFFFPASHDGGTAVGAALAASHALGVHAPAPATAPDDGLGHRYGPADVELALRARAERVEVSDVDLADVAERIAGGAIVGWFEGRAELGPRALGHRSILADPRDASTWRRVNRQVKYREDFRPFAPVVPLEHAARYFELDGASPYMLRVVRVRPEARPLLGAVCHVDGTARVQTVTARSHPRWHRLLHLVGERIGVPVLLNTSFTRRGEPLVETPLEALDVLLGSGLDALVLEDRLVRPRAPAEIGPDARLRLAPGLRLRSELGGGAEACTLQGSGRAAQVVPAEVAAVLRVCERGGTVAEGLAASPAAEARRSMILSWLTALHGQRYLNAVADAR